MTERIAQTMWDRQRADSGSLEPSRWYDRFNIYRHLGPGRTIEEAWRVWKSQQEGDGKVIKAERPHSGWYLRADEWKWRERAAEWDAAMARKAEAAMERKWRERAEEIREWSWQMFESLRKRVDSMLLYPLAHTRHEAGEGGEVTIIEPVRWSHSDITKTAKMASEIGRLSCGLETSRDVVEFNLTAKQFLEALPPDMREQVRQRLILKIKEAKKTAK